MTELEKKLRLQLGDEEFENLINKSLDQYRKYVINLAYEVLVLGNKTKKQSWIKAKINSTLTN